MYKFASIDKAVLCCWRKYTVENGSKINGIGSRHCASMVQPYVGKKERGRRMQDAQDHCRRRTGSVRFIPRPYWDTIVYILRNRYSHRVPSRIVLLKCVFAVCHDSPNTTRTRRRIGRGRSGNWMLTLVLDVPWFVESLDFRLPAGGWLIRERVFEVALISLVFVNLHIFFHHNINSLWNLLFCSNNA